MPTGISYLPTAGLSVLRTFDSVRCLRSLQSPKANTLGVMGLVYQVFLLCLFFVGCGLFGVCYTSACFPRINPPPRPDPKHQLTQQASSQQVPGAEFSLRAVATAGNPGLAQRLRGRDLPLLREGKPSSPHPPSQSSPGERWEQRRDRARRGVSPDPPQLVAENERRLQ